MWHETLIIGHRGAPRLAEENSITSFRLAFEAGADGIELDVRMTRDGMLVVHHDDDIPTVGRIAAMEWGELKRGCRVRERALHTLEDVFKQLAGHGFFDIELKEAGLAPVALTLARDLLPPNTFAFSSFRADVIVECRRHAPDEPAFLILEKRFNHENMLRLLKEIDATGIAPHFKLITEPLAMFFGQREVPIYTWTVNHLKDVQRLVELGVRGIITDVPGDLVKAAANA